MKIFFVLNSAWNAKNFRKNLILSFIKPDNDVYIISPAGDELIFFKKNGCKIIDYPLDRKSLNPFKELYSILFILKSFLKIRPDVVFSFTVKPNIYCGLIMKLHKGTKFFPNISGLGSSFLGKKRVFSLIKFLYKMTVKNAEIIFFQNDFDLELFNDLNIIGSQKKCRVLPGSGINLKDYFYQEDLASSSKNFLFIGRLIADKGINEFINVVKLCSENQELKFSIIGEIDTGNPSSLSIEDIKKFNEIKNLEYLGFQSDISSYIKKSYCIVLPSYREGTSRVLLEAGACGRPAIASNVPGCNNVIEDGINGLLCEPKSNKSLLKSVQKLSNISSVKYLEMCRSARKNIENNFDESIVIFNYHDVINV